VTELDHLIGIRGSAKERAEDQANAEREEFHSYLADMHTLRSAALRKIELMVLDAKGQPIAYDPLSAVMSELNTELFKRMHAYDAKIELIRGAYKK
jgi:hypothetical protein